ncbi:hypothetical protein GE107_02475 [Cohnella sp. CFH 77786]|uniref:hypothetical protein n=1 Tax=Cohnella sp. CFH 77786 TaxID=2662265 RepID=UPI001C609F90|nr:hypothetical protein [Cohnella sp. CFH 77786]MBW5444930.1 hypothetical protein [Cohnella sp. CFH 77786]
MKRKRYWASGLLAAFIILSIGIYYIQAASSHLPQFRLAALEGNEAEAEGLVLSAYYNHDALGEQAEITASGTRYESERPFLDRVGDLEGWMGSVQPIGRLTLQYPRFMRGRAFAEYLDDEAWVIRAELEPEYGVDLLKPSYRFRIDMLDKKTGKSRSFRADLPESKFDSKSIIDLQRFGTTIKAAVQYEVIGMDGRRRESEIRIYDIDLNEEKITGSAKVDFGTSAGDGREIRIFRVFEYHWTKPSDSLALEVSVMDVSDLESKDGTSGGIANQNATAVRQPVMAEHRLVIYHYGTGEVKQTSLPLSLPDASQNLFRTGPVVLWTRSDGQALDLKGYRASDAALAFEKKLTARVLGAESIGQTAIGPDRLYLALTASGTPEVAAVDPADGHLAFRGAVTIDGVDENEKKRLLSSIGVSSISVRS